MKPLALLAIAMLLCSCSSDQNKHAVNDSSKLTVLFDGDVPRVENNKLGINPPYVLLTDFSRGKNNTDNKFNLNVSICKSAGSTGVPAKSDCPGSSRSKNLDEVLSGYIVINDKEYGLSGVESLSGRYQGNHPLKLNTTDLEFQTAYKVDFYLWLLDSKTYKVTLIRHLEVPLTTPPLS